MWLSCSDRFPRQYSFSPTTITEGSPRVRNLGPAFARQIAMLKLGRFAWLAVGSLLVHLANSAIARAQVPSVEILHSFNGSDGSSPNGPLLAIGGDLWGTTRYGGQFGWGSIFHISRTGTFTTLYSFLGLGDGAWPQRLVLGPDGAVYGTTAEVHPYGSQT